MGIIRSIAILIMTTTASSSGMATETATGASILSSQDIPKFMTAVQAKDYGPIDEMLSVVENNVAVPRLSDLPPKKQSSHILIRTHAVALAPGDCRVLSGITREFQGPPSMPYIPGGDVCGTVVEMPTENSLPFGLGDVVAARFVGAPRGALGQYALICSNICEKIPNDGTALSVDEAAALAGATPSTLFADDTVQEGERVLVLGAGGGQGSHLCQLLREQVGKKGLVVGVSNDPKRLLQEPISCDRAIDYTQQNVWDMEEFQEKPFDIVIDMASGGWPKLVERASANKPLIVKTASKGGRFWTATMDTPTFEMRSVWQMFRIFLGPALGRAISTRLWKRWKLPKFTYLLGLPDKGNVMTRTLELVEEKTLKPVLDPKGPFPFTTEGVRDAFRLQESRHAKGKVVIHVADQNKY